MFSYDGMRSMSAQDMKSGNLAPLFMIAAMPVAGCDSPGCERRIGCWTPLAGPTAQEVDPDALTLVRIL